MVPYIFLCLNNSRQPEVIFCNFFFDHINKSEALPDIPIEFYFDKVGNSWTVHIIQFGRYLKDVGILGWTFDSPAHSAPIFRTLVISSNSEWQISGIHLFFDMPVVVSIDSKANSMQLYEFKPCQKISFKSTLLDPSQRTGIQEIFTFEVF